MEEDWRSRSRALLGESFLEKAADTKIILFGLGGVGSWTAEALVRTGFSSLTIVDFDRVAPSNINRQLPALHTTIGEKKTEVMKKRLLEINPEAGIIAIDRKYEAGDAPAFNLSEYDYVIDAIDILDDKADLILSATALPGVTLFSSMGAAMKSDPTKVQVAEFRNVKGCRLAAALRRKFKKMERFPRRKFKCVYDEELLPTIDGAKGSLMHITAIFGLTLAGLVTEDLRKKLKSII